MDNKAQTETKKASEYDVFMTSVFPKFMVRENPEDEHLAPIKDFIELIEKQRDAIALKAGLGFAIGKDFSSVIDAEEGRLASAHLQRLSEAFLHNKVEEKRVEDNIKGAKCIALYDDPEGKLEGMANGEKAAFLAKADREAIVSAIQERIKEHWEDKDIGPDSAQAPSATTTTTTETLSEPAAKTALPSTPVTSEVMTAESRANGRITDGDLEKEPFGYGIGHANM